jgi:hypothetical protein
MARDMLITHTTDRTFAERLMRDRHLVSDQGSHYVITSVRHMHDPFGKSMWPIHGHLESASETCPIGGSYGVSNGWRSARLF